MINVVRVVTYLIFDFQIFFLFFNARSEPGFNSMPTKTFLQLTIHDSPRHIPITFISAKTENYFWIYLQQFLSIFVGKGVSKMKC